MINEQYERAKSLLKEHEEGHHQLAELLIEKEVIFAEDVERIFGKRPWASRSEEIMAAQDKALEAKTEQENTETLALPQQPQSEENAHSEKQNS